jgi:DNA-binding PadR family transcriptional regulator
VLAEAGLVEVDKGYEGKRPRIWVRITATGRTALAAEIDSARCTGTPARTQSSG